MSEVLTIWEINRRRAVARVPVIALCVQAGIGTRTWHRTMAGTTEPRPDTIARLASALDRFKRAAGGELGPLSVHSAYKASLVIAAMHLRADAKAVIFSDPGRKATADKEWLEAARVRRVAYWISNALLGFRVSDVARAAGVTKQAVSSGIKELEDDNDPETRRVCRQLEEVFA